MKPAKSRIKPCPIAKRKSIITACPRLAESDAKAIIAAKIGVEHCVPARANTAPSKTGYKIEL